MVQKHVKPLSVSTFKNKNVSCLGISTTGQNAGKNSNIYHRHKGNSIASFTC